MPKHFKKGDHVYHSVKDVYGTVEFCDRDFVGIRGVDGGPYGSYEPRLELKHITQEELASAEVIDA